MPLSTQSAMHPDVLFRFDSVTALVSEVRHRHPDTEVWTERRSDDFLLCVRGARLAFESLIVHFEGEGCYAVELPAA